MKKKIFKKRGVILIEAIIAMAVIVVVMTALVSALVSAINSSSFSDDQTLATGYAQEGIEIMRSQKNNNFDQILLLSDGDYCVDTTGTKIVNSGCPNSIDSGKFVRSIYLNKEGYDLRNGKTKIADNLKCRQNGLSTSVYLVSTVSWESSRCDGGGRCHKVELESCLTNLSYIQ